MPEDQQQDGGFSIYVDGQVYSSEDMTFEEAEQYRRNIDELCPVRQCRACGGSGIIKIAEPDVPPTVEVCPLCGGDGEQQTITNDDYTLAFLMVFKRRTEPSFSAEDARKYKRNALEVPPTKTASKRKS